MLKTSISSEAVMKTPGSIHSRNGRYKANFKSSIQKIQGYPENEENTKTIKKWSELKTLE